MIINQELLTDIIKYPILTEKTIRLLENNQYSFAAYKTATKPMLKKAIEQLFSVKVLSINTLIEPIKKRKVGRITGKKTRTKKVIVRLKDGDSITLFDS